MERDALKLEVKNLRSKINDVHENVTKRYKWRMRQHRKTRDSSILEVHQMGMDIEPTEDSDETALLEEQLKVLREDYDKSSKQFLQFSKSNRWERI